MTAPKTGDLVVLRSGGPVMTVDAVNTDIFDDNKITGVSCVWFDGDKLQRVRFDHRAVEPAAAHALPTVDERARLEEATGEYKAALDYMVEAMNIPVEAAVKPPKRRKSAAASVASPVRNVLNEAG